MPVLRRWEESDSGDDHGGVCRVHQRPGAWRYDDSSEEKSDAKSDSGNLGWWINMSYLLVFKVN